MTDSIDTLKKQLRKKPALTPVDYSLGLSTGSTLVNLALTGRPSVGFTPGSFYLLPGDSASGKTFLSLTTLAEATINPKYDNYRLIYNAPERGARMSVAKFFGKRLAERLEVVHSETVEEFYFHLDDLIQAGTPFVEVLDSEASLSSKEEGGKFSEWKEAARKGKQAAGIYTDGKAKKHSSLLRRVITGLEKTGSILLMVTQSRDNIGFGAQFNPKTRAGGRALTFYATGEIWFSVRDSIKRTVNGKQRKIGSVLQVKVKKNRDTGREPTVELHHYPSAGFDDMGANIAYLVAEKHWAETKGKITAPEFALEGSAEKLIQAIEESAKEKQLRLLTAEIWREIDEQCQVKRKSRYT